MSVQLASLFLIVTKIYFIECSVIPTNNGDSVSAGSETPSTTQPATLPEGYVTFPDVNAAYKLHEEGKSWNAARDLCTAEGARLAIADTVKKIEHINSLKRTAALTWTHVGIYRSNATNEWVRVDNGLPLASLPWLVDNPDDSGDCAGVSLHVNALSNYGCEWDDEWFVCEIPI